MRIPSSALSEVKLQHLVSEKDSTIAVPASISAKVVTTGFTEWVGTWRSETVSVGWDWGVVDSLVVLLSQKEIRTNIQLIAQDQSPMPAALTQIHLFHWIESLPWRETAVNDLLRRP
ncbi:MAG: DUF4902 domain-containing protein [Sinobacteraceae bacterium]|nr:DUF4902 domain-containing protein [Nevskiaceae bacterium]